MIPTSVLRAARSGFGLRRGRVRLLSTRFGKVCLAHRTPGGATVQLRCVPELPDTLARLDAEMAWLHHLAGSHGLAVPAPHRWRGGRFVSPALVGSDGRPWRVIACRWVSGHHLNRGLDSREMARAGALLAALHLANRDAPADIAAARPTWWVPRLFELATTLRDLISGERVPDGMAPDFPGALRDAHARLVAAHDALPTGAAHIGLIHTDAHWQNLRFTPVRVGVVDFEDVATGRFMLDLACLWGKVEGRRDSRSLLQAALDGYDRVRPLPGGAERDLQVMLAFRRLDYAGWVLSWPRPDREPWGPAFLAGTPAYMTRQLRG